MFDQQLFHQYQHDGVASILLVRAVAAEVRALPFEEGFRASNTNVGLDFLPNQKSMILLSDDRAIPQSKPFSYQGLP